MYRREQEARRGLGQAVKISQNNDGGARAQGRNSCYHGHRKKRMSPLAPVEVKRQNEWRWKIGGT